MTQLDTQPNERPDVKTRMEHQQDLPSCCPVSKNPQPGSTIKIRYRAGACMLEVYALRKYLDSYVDGRGPVRSMEAMIQTITDDCAAVLGVSVYTTANLILDTGPMIIRCEAHAS